LPKLSWGQGNGQNPKTRANETRLGRVGKPFWSPNVLWRRESDEGFHS